MKTTLVTLLAISVCFSAIKAQQGQANLENKTTAMQLIALLKNEKVFIEDPDKAANAVIKLGEIGAVDAIPVLIEHVDFCDKRQDIPARGYSPENCRVALEALVNIGKASLQPVLEASKKEDNRLRLICMAAVIRNLEGKKKGQELLDLHVTQALDLKTKERLEQVKAFIASPPSN